jgi:hypothetical protein
MPELQLPHLIEQNLIHDTWVQVVWIRKLNCQDLKIDQEFADTN